jgi:hypothetical protein
MFALEAMKTSMLVMENGDNKGSSTVSILLGHNFHRSLSVKQFFLSHTGRKSPRPAMLGGLWRQE